MDIFKIANTRLESFIKNDLDSYHFARNYDYGIKNRSNVSQISKYTSHRILYEYEVIEKLRPVDRKKKFTDEILWRLYWKGYLENYKSIWNEYRNFNNISSYSNILEKATRGQTGIECFDAWIQELRENNYLHNHARMWFASIWIFTLRIPWQLGARFFMKYLLDGDAASNTLSWRWVAGMHTNKKPYFASAENINKYTCSRFKNFTFNISSKRIIIKQNTHLANKIPCNNSSPKSNILFMFENDLNISNRSWLFNSYHKIYLLLNKVIENKICLSDEVINFKQILIENINDLIPSSEIINPNDLDKLLSEHNCIDVIYPGVGSNLDFINNFCKEKLININYIYRENDLMNWKYAKSGFYKFKSSYYLAHNINSG